MTDHAPERRGFPRIAVSVAAIIKGKDDIVVGLVENISLGGFYMHAQNRIFIEAGEAVTVDIYLNDSDQIHSILKLRARTVWVNEKGIGVQFGPMTPSDQTWLKAVMNFLAAEDSAAEDGPFLQFQLS
jgi:hypothetical protein